MCEYCEQKKELKSCNFCGGAKLLIHEVGFEDDFGMLELCGEENKFQIFKRVYRPRFDIKYCPMCGKRLGKNSKNSYSSTEQVIKNALNLIKDIRNEIKKENIGMKVMISQPMNGRSKEDIEQERKEIIEKFNIIHIDVLDTLFNEDAPEDTNPGVYFLGKSLEMLAKADALYMCKGWEQSRGCKIEKIVAQYYGIKILDTNFLEG